MRELGWQGVLAHPCRDQLTEDELMSTSVPQPGKKRRTPEYHCWAAMLARCRNPNTPGYKNYGGRGITVCDRWAVFSNFIEDMGRRPSDRHSLDRIDTNGNYCPENCRWATTKQQARNKVRTTFVVYRGEKRLLADLAEELNVGLSLLRYRVNTGVVEDQWGEPPLRKTHLLEVAPGRFLTLKTAAVLLGITANGLRLRIKRGQAYDGPVPPAAPWPM